MLLKLKNIVYSLNLRNYKRRVLQGKTSFYLNYLEKLNSRLVYQPDYEHPIKKLEIFQRQKKIIFELLSSSLKQPRKLILPQSCFKHKNYENY